MRGNFVRIAPIIMLLLLSGCADSPFQTGVEARQNRENMLKLNIGQTKDQVLAILGKPYKTEMYVVDGKPVEFWLYLTKGIEVDDRTLRDSNFTPVVFENGSLKGWGRNYYDRSLRIKKDITIEKK